MIETITIITLSVLFLIFFRPGKTPPLNNPLVIERPDHYHMTLPPQLNLAQPFIEAVAAQIGTGRSLHMDITATCLPSRNVTECCIFKQPAHSPANRTITSAQSAHLQIPFLCGSMSTGNTTWHWMNASLRRLKRPLNYAASIPNIYRNKTGCHHYYFNRVEHLVVNLEPSHRE